MGQNADGSATCDYGGEWLEGYGVLYGMVTSDLLTETIRNLIVCYDHLPDVLHGLLLVGGGSRCPHCGVTVTRAVASGLLATDLAPGTGEQREMTFCYINGGAAALVTRLNL